METEGFFQKLKNLIVTEKKEAVGKRVDRERDEFLKNLPDEASIACIEKNICLVHSYCTHYFALAHDAYRNGHKHVFMCWKLENCLCVIKKKFGCDNCEHKRRDHSLCWGRFEQK
jgi:hypothetical protein